MKIDKRKKKEGMFTSRYKSSKQRESLESTTHLSRVALESSSAVGTKSLCICKEIRIKIRISVGYKSKTPSSPTAAINLKPCC